VKSFGRALEENASALLTTTVVPVRFKAFATRATLFAGVCQRCETGRAVERLAVSLLIATFTELVGLALEAGTRNFVWVPLQNEAFRTIKCATIFQAGAALVVSAGAIFSVAELLRGIRPVSVKLWAGHRITMPSFGTASFQILERSAGSSSAAQFQIVSFGGACCVLLAKLGSAAGCCITASVSVVLICANPMLA